MKTIAGARIVKCFSSREDVLTIPFPMLPETTFMHPSKLNGSFAGLRTLRILLFYHAGKVKIF